MTSSSLISTPISTYQNKICDYSLSDLFLLNYKKSISSYDFSTGINESSGVIAADSFQFNLQMRAKNSEIGIKLPSPKKIRSKLSLALYDRKTLRQFQKGDLDLVDFSTLLHYVLRVKPADGHRKISRSYSSGGGCYPISFYFYNKNNRRVVEIARETAELYGADAEVEFHDFDEPLVNDGCVVDEVRAVVSDFLLPECLIKDQEKSLGANDFADYLAVVKGMYAFVGTNNEKDPNTGSARHHGLFDIDEEALLLSCNIYVDYALWWLKGEKI